MLEQPIKVLAAILCGIVTVSFTLFAVDETRVASADSRMGIAAASADGDPGASAALERARERDRSGIRRAIDDSNEVIVAPFHGLVASSSEPWVRRGVPAALALLVFGVGLGYLARWARGTARSQR